MNKKILILAAALMLPIAANAQVTRQESTNQLKKVVYSGMPSACSQFVLHGSGDEIFHYAVVSIPEISAANMPSISIYFYGGTNSPVWNTLNLQGLPQGWYDVFAPAPLYAADEGRCYLRWKVESGPMANPPWVDARDLPFKIVVIYEASTTTLTVANPGTGKSLRLNWKVDPAAGQVVRGYQVLRREAQVPAAPALDSATKPTPHP